MMDNLWIVLTILSENNLKIQLTETKFFRPKLRFRSKIFFNSVGGKIHPRKSKQSMISTAIDTLKRLRYNGLCFHFLLPLGHRLLSS
jgi:hypothetical protein